MTTSSVRRVDTDRPPALGGAVGEPVPRALEQPAHVQRLGPHRQAAVGRAREHQQVLRQLRQPVALLDRGDERLALLAVDRTAAQRALRARS